MRRLSNVEAISGRSESLPTPICTAGLSSNGGEGLPPTARRGCALTTAPGDSAVVRRLRRCQGIPEGYYPDRRLEGVMNCKLDRTRPATRDSLSARKWHKDSCDGDGSNKIEYPNGSRSARRAQRSRTLSPIPTMPPQQTVRPAFRTTRSVSRPGHHRFAS